MIRCFKFHIPRILCDLLYLQYWTNNPNKLFRNYKLSRNLMLYFFRDSYCPKFRQINLLKYNNFLFLFTDIALLDWSFKSLPSGIVLDSRLLPSSLLICDLSLNKIIFVNIYSFRNEWYFSVLFSCHYCYPFILSASHHCLRSC